MNEAVAGSELDWALVLAPFRKDSDYIAAFLREQKLEVKAAGEDSNLTRLLSTSPGLMVIAHEALSRETIAKIAEHLAEQPDWSELPILVLLERAAPIARIRDQLEHAWPGARLLFHTRPIAPLELVNSIHSSLSLRLRQRQVRDSLEREKELRLELNHRVKNILASVTSIFQMTRRGAATVEELADNFSSRLGALSKVHAAVFEAGGEEVSVASVIDVTVAPYNNDDVTRIDVSGPDILVSRSSATTMALCLHELITNAIKYGALSDPDGHVKIIWSIAGTGTPIFSLTWSEAGGPQVQEPTRQGYGTRYVRSAFGSLFGVAPEIFFAPEGFRCHVGGPLDRLTRQ